MTSKRKAHTDLTPTGEARCWRLRFLPPPRVIRVQNAREVRPGGLLAVAAAHSPRRTSQPKGKHAPLEDGEWGCGGGESPFSALPSAAGHSDRDWGA